MQSSPCNYSSFVVTLTKPKEFKENIYNKTKYGNYFANFSSFKEKYSEGIPQIQKITQMVYKNFRWR